MWRSPVYRFMTPSDTRDEIEGNNNPLTRPSIRSITRALEERSTAHGLPNLNKARGIVKKCFWASAILLMLCGLVYNARGLIVEYLRYDVSASISIQQEQQLVFPSVTICNMSPVKKSALTTNSSKTVARRKREVDNGDSNKAILSSTKEAIIADTDNGDVSLHSRMATDFNERASKMALKVDNRRKRTIDDTGDKDKVSRKRVKRATETCYPNWNLRNGYCYYVSPGNLTGGLVDSYVFCLERGGNLVSILDEAEQNYVASLSIDLYKFQYWIGLLRFPVVKNNVTTPHTWWTDGSTANYLNTVANETIDYTKYFYMASSGLWLSSYANVSRPFICKMPANATRIPTTTSPMTSRTIAPTTSAGLTTTWSITYGSTGNIPLTTTKPPYPTSTKSPTTSTVALSSTTKATSTVLKSTSAPSTTTRLDTSSATKATTTTLFDSISTTKVKTTTKVTTLPTTTKGPPTTTMAKETTIPPTSKVTSTVTTAKETTTPPTTKVTTTAATAKETTIPTITKTTSTATTTKETPTQVTFKATPTTTFAVETTTLTTSKAIPTTAVTTETTTPTTTKATPTAIVTTEATTPTTYKATPTTILTTEATTPTTRATSATTITTETTTPTTTKITPTAIVTTEATTPTTYKATPTTILTTEVTTPTTKATSATTLTTETTTPTTTKTTPTAIVTTEAITPTTYKATPTTILTTEATTPTTKATSGTTITTETTTPTTTKTTSTSTPQVLTTDSTRLPTSTLYTVPNTETTPTPTKLDTTTTDTTYIAATTTTATTTATTTTTRATTVQPEAPPIGCCCRCCSTGGQFSRGESCATCTGAQMDGATGCAVNKTSLLATPISSEPNFEAAAKLNGSRFPERLAVTESFQESQQLTETLANLPEEVKVGLGYSREEFILDCRYDGNDCQGAIDFTEFYNPIHGNCYVFNSGWTNGSNRYIATQPGRGHGLKLWLNILQEEYTAQSGDTAGAVVLIQSQHEMPFPEDEGIMLSPGHLTSIAVTQLTINKMPAPYSNCTDDVVNDTQRNVYAEAYPVEYTVTSCQKTCYQRIMIERCRCTDPYVPTFEADVNSSIPVCSLVNMTQDDCSYAVRKMFAANTLSCACPERCSDTRFSVKNSMSAWPNKKQKEATLRKLATKIGESGNFFDPETVDDNLLALEIYFETFHYEEIKESPSYPLINLISDIGGVVGLWFGFAFMTFLEFFEYFVDVFVLLGKRLSRNCSKN